MQRRDVSGNLKMELGPMESLSGGGNAILALLVGVITIAVLAAAAVAARRQQGRTARALAGGAVLLAAVYGGGVVAASAASVEKTLPPGTTKWFCGFYLDCHLGLSVREVESTPALGEGGGAVAADGIFHVVTLRLHNSARNPKVHMILERPDVRLVDSEGRTYRRSPAGEAALAGARGPAVLGPTTRVENSPVDAIVVFDVPEATGTLRLKVSHGGLPERVVELALIGDENSILHRPVLLALDSAR